MTREETKKIIMIIASAYTNFKPNSLTMIVDSWHFLLAEHDFNSIAEALKEFVNTSGSAFAPSPAELIAIAKKNNVNRMWQRIASKSREIGMHATRGIEEGVRNDTE